MDNDKEHGMQVCQPHLERTGKKVPAFKMSMCFDCWSGQPIYRSEIQHFGKAEVEVMQRES